MGAALSMMAACRPATPATDRVIALYAMWRDDDEDYEPRRRRSSACECFAPGECAGSCPGPENCPMCEGDTDDTDDDTDENEDPQPENEE